MRQVVLLGDSILDNGAYTGGGPDVVTQVRGVLPSGWRATLGAVDGATTETFGRQLTAIRLFRLQTHPFILGSSMLRPPETVRRHSCLL